jgi:hypothetical protein
VRFAAKNDLCAGTRGEFAMPADEVGVQVSFNDVFDREILARRFVDVLIDVALWIDDGGLAV